MTEKHHPVSDSLVASVVEQMSDPVEIKVVLTAATLGAEHHPVAEADLLAMPSLRRGVRSDGSSRDPGRRVIDALRAAVTRGILIALTDDTGQRWYRASTAAARHVLNFEAVVNTGSDRHLRVERPDVFGLYEQNIGVITPIMADRLMEAIDTYPDEWIHDAIGEAVTYNKRNWRYIQRILENWTTEGRTGEANQRDHEGHLDRSKYVGGAYRSSSRRR